jgi:hypothetical protein
MQLVPLHAGVLFALFAIVQSGKVGGLSARVRGLFVPHTRTGNPLVDSVVGPLYKLNAVDP